jgi:hypothetical protein
MSLKSAILLVAAIFAITVLVRLPAGVLPLLLPASIHCQSPTGTLWHGSCRELSSGALALSDVRWGLHPLALLRAHLLVDVQSDDARAAGQAQLMLHGNGDLQIQALNASLRLQGGLSALPPGWSGALQLAIDQASMQGGYLTAIEGVITVRQLHSDNPPAELGSFQLQFPGRESTGAAPMLGTLRDLEGPLSLQGQLQLLPSGAYELSGTVAARDSSSADLQQMLQLLGPLDAQGRHTFSLAGTF